ncbi:MAG TPA: hypothetical protein DDE71_07715, partial [Tenacibaculum sp.]|nr:hypothetical protein [Tenacibaculum sp.]
MQTVSNNDGIYNDEPLAQHESQRSSIITPSDNEFQKNEDNYFSKELERIGLLNGTDIFTDIDNYKSDTNDDFELENNFDTETEEINRSYNSYAPWGYHSNDNDVVINVNTNPNWG